MIDDNLKPWLLEINKCPSMTTCTNVQERLVTEMFEDLFKVILDYPKDNSTNTGFFIPYHLMK